MFRLPICPHCHTIYRYSEVKKATNHKKLTCYHCKKEFSVSKKNIILLFIAVCVIAMVVNVIQLYISPSLNIMMIFATNIILVIIGLILVPYFIRFKKIFKKEDKSKLKNMKH